MSIAIIGGSGLDQLQEEAGLEPIYQQTPFGEHSQGVCKLNIGNTPVVFLPRHGKDHHLPPHKVNYRANMWLLKSLGITKIVAMNVVGGITDEMSPRTLLVPHQVIDYTWGREHTYFDGLHHDTPFIDKYVDHIDFTQPYSEALRQRIIGFLDQSKINHVNYGVYGCTQGPRLESAAEVQRLQNDGCHIVGMTAMPETALAKELEMDYASLGLVVNWAPGIAAEELSFGEIMQLVSEEMAHVQTFLPDLLEFLTLQH